MTNQTILTFKTLAPLLLPELINLNYLESIEDYDDYALLTFNLAKPVYIETILDQFEDQMELSILYHMATSIATDASHHCCAYSNPGFGHMYKINVITVLNGMADTLYVHLYDSLEVMLEALKDDMEQHSQFGHFISKMEMGRFIADFM